MLNLKCKSTDRLIWTEFAKPSVRAIEGEFKRSLERRADVMALKYPSPVATMEIISIASFLGGLRPDEELQVWGENSNASAHVLEMPSRSASDCTMCPGVVISSVVDLRAHFKTNWHLHNLRARQSGDPILSEAEFNALQANEDLLSDSCSSVSENEAESPHSTPGTPMVRFYRSSCTSKEGRPTAYEVYKSAFCRSEELHRGQKIDYGALGIRLRLAHIAESRWLILLIRSGRVAAAIFDNQSGHVLYSKTFKRYTVRRKQGGSQLARDAANAGRIKSAGASIRRMNELHLIEDVQQLISEWNSAICKCSLIFWNPTVTGRFCLAETPILRSNDGRLRSIPFTTYKPSLEEIQRCYRRLAGVHCLHQIEG